MTAMRTTSKGRPPHESSMRARTESATGDQPIVCRRTFERLNTVLDKEGDCYGGE
ncbi:MAG: hypothetical protein JWL61_2367 [Gemmatimonadetes bacterium]|nr:hypothetical protein [Gemmatimonadota bacterium]